MMPTDGGLTTFEDNDDGTPCDNDPCIRMTSSFLPAQPRVYTWREAERELSVEVRQLVARVGLTSLTLRYTTGETVTYERAY